VVSVSGADAEEDLPIVAVGDVVGDPSVLLGVSDMDGVRPLAECVTEKGYVDEAVEDRELVRSLVAVIVRDADGSVIDGVDVGWTESVGEAEAVAADADNDCETVSVSLLGVAS
jgi:hypothetical protein